MRFLSVDTLTKREKKVLYGLTRWPDASDGQLGAFLSLKRSTVTVIRNRLYKNGFFIKRKIPNFKALNLELLAIAYGGFSPQANFTKRLQIGLTKIACGWNSFIFGISTEKGFVAVFALKNYTEIEKIRTFCFREYGDCFKDVELVIFPLEIYRIVHFFNFAPILKELFELSLPEVSESISNSKKRAISIQSLKPIDKKVLHYLVKYPDENDQNLAKLAKISRVTFSKTRKKLEGNGLVKSAVLPNFKKLNVELVALIHGKFAPKVSYEVRTEGHALIDSLPHHFMMITGDREGIILGLYKNYTDFEQYYELLDNFYRLKGFFISPPFSAIFPIQNIRFQRINFKGLV